VIPLGCKCMEGRRWEVVNRLEDILFGKRVECCQLGLLSALVLTKTENEIFAACSFFFLCTDRYGYGCC